MEDPEFRKLIDENWITFTIHQLAKTYHYSKSQIDEIYPEEASVLLRFVYYENQQSEIIKRLNEYNQTLQNLYVQHGSDLDAYHKEILSKIQELQGMLVPNATPSPELDDDLPDIAKLHKLKEFRKEHKMR